MRQINPRASITSCFSEKQLVMLARGFICLVVLVTYLFTLAEPRQVFSLGIWCFSGFAGLFPLVFAAIYWKKATKAGAYAGVIGGALVWLILFQASNYGADKEYSIGGMMPVVPILFTCAICLIVVSLFTSAPSQATLEKFFPKKT